MGPISINKDLKILLAIKAEDAANLRRALEDLGHRVEWCSQLEPAVLKLRTWQPDLLIVDEGLDRRAPEAGIRLATMCWELAETSPGRQGTQAILLVTSAEWSHFAAARRTGAHVVHKTADLGATIRYVQAVSDQLATDRILGPVLIGVHGYYGVAPEPDCAHCEWRGSSLLYGTSRRDLGFYPLGVLILNILMARRRGQSVDEMAQLAGKNAFLRRLHGKRPFQTTSVKMEVTRMRQTIRDECDNLGSSCGGTHFLPTVRHGFERYRLTGNWQLLHVQLD
jgi:CheY-like chemotaxis protein